MLRAFRLLRLALAMTLHTARTERELRRTPPAERARVQAEGLQRGTQACLRAMGVTLRVEGSRPDHPMLIVANHLGLLDGFVIAAAVPAAFVARADMLRWPFIGWVVRTFGTIGVERERKTATDDFVETVQERLKQGANVLVFAEGTTSKGPLLPFKTGAFEAVAKSPFEVLPLYHRPLRMRRGPVQDVEPLTWADPADPLPRNLWRVLGLAPIEVLVRFGEPIPAQGQSRKALAAESFARVAAMRAETEAEAVKLPSQAVAV